MQGYAAHVRTITLLAIPARQDISTIEAQEWAARYDPSGRRTIGVITRQDPIEKDLKEKLPAYLIIDESLLSWNILW